MRIRRPHLALAALLLAAAAAPLAAQASPQTERRTYWFEAAEREQEYRLFVPSGYDAGQPAPLVVLLHGLGSTPRQVMGYRGIREQAEKRGYLVVAPYGYNRRGWYGARGKGKEGPFFGAADDPDNLGELSELDVLNVLGIVRDDYAVDPDRIYLMGHSMGGAGTIHLGATHPGIWAALAPLAPALDGSSARLRTMKHIPVHMVTGDADRLVKVAIVRRWVAAMQQLEMDHEYVEIEGGDHVRAIAQNPEMIAGVFDFFDARRRAEPAAEKEAGKREPAAAGKR